MSGFTPNEMMTIAASRALRNDDVCFVGIGAPSAACNVARLTHAPDITLIYESGTIGTAPDVLPLSIGDGELCETAVTTVAVPEMFRYWLQGGRISIGFLGAAQLDKFGNINTTVIGDYAIPRPACPAAAARRDRHLVEGDLHHHGADQRGMVEKIDFFTSSAMARRRSPPAPWHRHAGPTLLSTDLAIWRPDPVTKEFAVVSLLPGVSRQQVQDSCGWVVKFTDTLDETPATSELELKTLRDLQARTKAAHEGSGKAKAA